MFGARVCGSETASIVLNRPSAVTHSVPLKPTDNSLSLWCSCKTAHTQCHLFSREWFAIHQHQRSGRIYARPRCTSSRKCIPSALLDELFAAFSRDDEWSGRGLSLFSWGKPEEENIDIWGSLALALRSSNVQSQPSLNNRGTLMSQKAESSGTTRPITSYTL